MIPEDRRLAAVIAAFAPERGEELAALVADPSGGDVRAAVAALVRRGRSARLAALADALAPPGGSDLARPPENLDAPSPGSARVRERLRLEALWGGAPPPSAR